MFTIWVLLSDNTSKQAWSHNSTPVKVKSECEPWELNFGFAVPTEINHNTKLMIIKQRKM